ncbi:hypothetical protein AA313_de0204568 [Arthrobotrys entomopaga]|nr:hypothetical protein AA313_de0204568 [Arthrobotrys entomopaga]
MSAYYNLLPNMRIKRERIVAHSDYTVGWISALPLEMAAARMMLDAVHKKLPQDPKDQNTYILGSIYGHNVVIACLPSGVYGTVSATAVITQMLMTFRSLRFILMVGIGGGAPSQKVDIRLGDVVVSKPSDTSGGVIQYDYGKTVEEGRFQRTGSLNKPPQVLLTAMSQLQEANLRGKSQIQAYLSEIGKKYPNLHQFLYCGQEFDHLYESEYDHVGTADDCKDCDKIKLISRTPRASSDPQIHYGLIASGNQVMKHAATRDRLTRELGIFCFEMEAAGLMDQFPCLVIRGICDYSDSHKNRWWQEYAAATAAAYAKELLSVVSIHYVQGALRVRETPAVATAIFASSIIGFLGISNNILASLYTSSTMKATPNVLKDIAVQLPVLADSIEKIAADCRERLITEEDQTKLLPVVAGCLEQIIFLDKLIQRMLPTPEDSWWRRFKKSVARFLKGKVVFASLSTLENYKSTLLVHLEQSSKMKINSLCKATEMREEELSSVQRQNMEIIAANWLRPSGTNCIHTTCLPGTCEWIWTDAVFVKWLEPSRHKKSERFLCLQGVNGCGKSVLATSVVKELKKKDCKVLFFSFSGTDSDRQTLDSLARNFLWQLLQEASDDRIFKIIQRLRLQNPLVTLELLEALLEIAKLLTETVYCIIDGLDESVEDCNDQDRGLLKHILDILDFKNFHIALFARPRALQAAMGLSLNIEINNSKVKADLERFIRSEINNSPIFNTPSLQDQVFGVLLEGSDGMFLWVKLMIEDLRKSATVIELTDRLRDMPRGIEKLYRLLLKRLLENLDDRELSLARKVLTFIIAARRILTVNELQHCYSLSLESTSALEDRFILQPEMRILAVCGDLVNITNGHVQIIHNSIKEFLTRPTEQWLSDDDIKIRSFRVDMEAAHLSLSHSCLDYLLMDCYELSSGAPDDVFSAEKHPFAKYSSKYGISHLIRSGHPQSAILNKINTFLKSQLFPIWVEYVATTVFEDPNTLSALYDFEELENWLNFDDPALDQCRSKLEDTVQQLEQRIERFHKNYMQTGWLVTFDRLKRAARGNQEMDTRITVGEAPKDTSAAIIQIMNLVRRQGVSQTPRKLDLWLTLGFYLGHLQAKVLTDPLRLLFEAILGMADRIPVLLLMVIGRFYVRFDKLDEAIKIYNIALSKNGPDQKFIESIILEIIGDVLYDQKKYVKAEDSCRQALKLSENIHGREHRQTLRLVHKLGYILQTHSEAEAMTRRALEGRRRLIGKEHPDTLESMHRLGWILSQQNKYSEAEEIFRQAIDGRRKVLGKEHRRTLVSMGHLGCALYEQGKYSEAEEMLRLDLEGTRKLFGKKHPATLTCMHNLGRVLLDQGKYLEAKKVHRMAAEEEEVLQKYPELSACLIKLQSALA